MSAELGVPLSVVCRATGAPRSTIYHRRSQTDAARHPGPTPVVPDEVLANKIAEVITESPFAGEGHRKVRARLRREHQLVVGKNRVLRLMREQGLLAPQRARRRRTPREHNGTITTTAPNLRWGTDATMAWTRDDGWVWVFILIDHYSDEAWAHVAKVGNRFAAIQPVYDAVIDRFGSLSPDIARGIKLRHDWGSQYRSGHFQGSLTWLGIQDDASYVGEPECNGVAERFIRTLKEQCLWAHLCNNIDDLRDAVATFIELYNNEWLIERLGHRTPRETFIDATAKKAA